MAGDVAWLVTWQVRLGDLAAFRAAMEAHAAVFVADIIEHDGLECSNHGAHIVVADI